MEKSGSPDGMPCLPICTCLKQKEKIQKTEYKAPVISKKLKTGRTELAFPPKLYPL